MYEPRIKKNIDLYVSRVSQEEAVDATDWSMYLAFDIIGKIGLGTNFGCLARGASHPAIQEIHGYMEILGALSHVPWLMRLISCIAGVNWQPNERPRNIVSWLVKAFVEEDVSAPPSIAALHEDSHTIIAAGSETVATTLAAILYYLAKHPVVIRKLQTKIDAIMPTTADCNSEKMKLIPYVDDIINEALRLKPPVLLGGPRVTPPEGIRIEKHYIPGDVIMSIPVQKIQTDERYWKRGSEFIPERFGELRRAYACIGKNLALMTLRMATCRIAQEFDVVFAPGENGETFDKGAKYQTTRANPRWNLLAPEIQQRQALPKNDETERKRWGRGSVQKWFFKEGLSWGAFEKLARPTAAACDDKTPAATPLSLLVGLKRPATTLSVLESLPAELFRMVTSELDIPDKVALGLCSQWLWSNFLPELQAVFSKNTAPWAGQIIMCTSTWMTDWPPALQAAYPELGLENAEWLKTCRGMPPARKWNWDTYSYKDAQDLLDLKLESQYRRAIEDKNKGEDGLPEKLQAVLVLQIKEVARYHLRRVPHGSTWVLRNLDTRELVRFERIIAESSETIQVAVKGSPWLTLDFALTMRICWEGELSDEPEDPTDDRWRAPLQYGVWAGHRFDVIRAEDLNSKEEWRDVTTEVVNEAKELHCSLPTYAYDSDDNNDNNDNDASNSSMAVNDDDDSSIYSINDSDSESDSDSDK
ncbi:hypothetical protein SLS62_005102 [Diatrype stigma]|uniref:Cytochrome P450 n=1 Tax=Diatrype stigma TaxID=117547 RepID=A0AAN9YNR4_9PEZI